MRTFNNFFLSYRLAKYRDKMNIVVKSSIKSLTEGWWASHKKLLKKFKKKTWLKLLSIGAAEENKTLLINSDGKCEIANR